MLTLVNTNRMQPPIAPIGLDYVASAAQAAGFEVDVLDLCLAENPESAFETYFAGRQPELVGMTLRNVDDCFWPSAQSFLPMLERDVAAVRGRTGAPIVLGGVGYSIFPQPIVERTGVDFGVCGDGEPAIVALLQQLRGPRQWDRVPGLVYRREGTLYANSPAWPDSPRLVTRRDAIDNTTYFRRGGQLGVETKRGCARTCIYCADPLAKGRSFRVRDPAEVGDEIECLLAQGVDILHLCDPEFNLPPQHATAICQELIRRQLGQRIRWYAYLAVTPFSAELAELMARAGCAGINFTSDAAHAGMLATYRQPHRRMDLEAAVRRCRRNGIAVMLDMLLGGPGETPETLTETIRAFQQIDPDCAGAALGIRIYPGTPVASLVADEGAWETNPGIRRHYGGPVNLLEPTFYISAALGPKPALLVRELLGNDERFFPPALESDAPSDDHNYNDNRDLTDAIARGERGAYWDILRRLRT